MEITGPDVKKRILAAAAELIREEQDFDKVSMRRIAERAGVAVSMVNYHYQTKARLIEKAVQYHIDRVIEASEAPEAKPQDPVSAMRSHLKGAAHFLANNPGISRVSILRDLHDAHEGDNSSRTLALVYEQLKRIFGTTRSEYELKVLSLMQLAIVQHLFLRAEHLHRSMDLDFFDESQRNALMDTIVHIITGRSEK